MHATREDAEYLISGVNESFPKVNLSLEDIQSSWAGLRPLIHEEGKSPSELSRKDEIFESKSGLISIAGGKLTGYRKMAERIVDLVIEKHFGYLSLRECQTEKLKLVGADFDEPAEVKQFVAEVQERLQHYHLEAYATYLVYNYGKNTDKILTHLESNFQDYTSETLGRAECWYCIHYEMALSLLDFFNRRTGMLFFNMERVTSLMAPISSVFKEGLKWENEKLITEQRKLESAIHHATAFKNFA